MGLILDLEFLSVYGVIDTLDTWFEMGGMFLPEFWLEKGAKGAIFDGFWAVLWDWWENLCIVADKDEEAFEVKEEKPLMSLEEEESDA